MWTLIDPRVKCDYRVSESSVSNSNTCKSFATNCKFFSSKASFSPPPILRVWCQRVSKGRRDSGRTWEREEASTESDCGAYVHQEICGHIATPGGQRRCRAVKRFATTKKRPIKYELKKKKKKRLTQFMRNLQNPVLNLAFTFGFNHIHNFSHQRNRSTLKGWFGFSEFVPIERLMYLGLFHLFAASGFTRVTSDAVTRLELVTNTRTYRQTESEREIDARTHYRKMWSLFVVVCLQSGYVCNNYFESVSQFFSFILNVCQISTKSKKAVEKKIWNKHTDVYYYN